MASLTLTFLGPFQVTLDGAAATGFESNKVRALLVYLAVEAARPHAREALADLLWPDSTDHLALSSLRSALANLRGAIGDREADPPYLLITRDTVRFNPASDYSLDVGCLHNPHHLPVEALERAVDACRGDFLEGFTLDGSPSFEAWLLARREELNRMRRDALRRLATHYEARGDYDKATVHARGRLDAEAWDEEAHRQLMRLLAASGRRDLALAQFETCRRLLREELGIEPSRETLALYASIRDETD